MKTTISLAVMVHCLGFGNLAVGAQGTSRQTPVVEKHIAAARALAGSRYSVAMERQCAPPDSRPRPTFADLALEPVRVFDNLYFLGQANVYAWAVDTPDGIILLDSLNNDQDAEVTIAGGLKKLGLDPSRIKYVVISHSHADHFGGAPYLKKTYGARPVASDADWRVMEQMTASGPGATPPPSRDVVVSDGETLTLGGTTLTFVMTPGHTPGALSVIVPLSDRGQRHVAVFMPGPRTDSLETTRQMLASTEKLAAIAKAAKVDVELNNHSYVDDSLPVIEATRNRKTGEPNPFVIGEEGFQRFAGWQAECLKADIARSER